MLHQLRGGGGARAACWGGCHFRHATDSAQPRHRHEHLHAYEPEIFAGVLGRRCSQIIGCFITFHASCKGTKATHEAASRACKRVIESIGFWKKYTYWSYCCWNAATGRGRGAGGRPPARCHGQPPAAPAPSRPPPAARDAFAGRLRRPQRPPLRAKGGDARTGVLAGWWTDAETPEHRKCTAGPTYMGAATPRAPAGRSSPPRLRCGRGRRRPAGAGPVAVAAWVRRRGGHLLGGCHPPGCGAVAAVGSPRVQGGWPSPVRAPSPKQPLSPRRESTGNSQVPQMPPPSGSQPLPSRRPRCRQARPTPPPPSPRRKTSGTSATSASATAATVRAHGRE